MDKNPGIATDSRRACKCPNAAVDVGVLIDCVLSLATTD